jgi:hypothetical protein
MAEWTDPAVLPLTADAQALVLQFEAEVEPKLKAGNEYGHIRDWASKYVGATVRLAGLLHLADHITDGWAKAISAETMTRAIALGRYFAAHALAAYDLIGDSQNVEDARLILAWIERKKPVRFSRNELAKGVSRARFKTVTDLDPPLELLEHHGYLRRDPPPERKGPGRPPTATFQVHPNYRNQHDQGER